MVGSLREVKEISASAFEGPVISRSVQTYLLPFLSRSDSRKHCLLLNRVLLEKPVAHSGLGMDKFAIQGDLKVSSAAGIHRALDTNSGRILCKDESPRGLVARPVSSAATVLNVDVDVYHFFSS